MFGPMRARVAGDPAVGPARWRRGARVTADPFSPTGGEKGLEDAGRNASAVPCGVLLLAAPGLIGFLSRLTV